MSALFDIDGLVERVLAHVNVEQIAGDVMSKMKMEHLDLYFVVGELEEDSDGYEFFGMAYSVAAAKEIQKSQPGSIILQANLGKLLWQLAASGAVKQIK